MGNSSFEYNATTKGGAICLIASKIGNTTIANNTTTDSGGGMYIFLLIQKDCEIRPHKLEHLYKHKRMKLCEGEGAASMRTKRT